MGGVGADVKKPFDAGADGGETRTFRRMTVGGEAGGHNKRDGETDGEESCTLGNGKNSGERTDAEETGGTGSRETGRSGAVVDGVGTFVVGTCAELTGDVRTD